MIQTPPADVYVETPYSSDYGYRTYRPGPRVYGYTRSYDNPYDDGDLIQPRYRGGCGTYHYWNGDRCVDARR